MLYIFFELRVEKTAAEALLISLEALRLHEKTGYSPKSGLYTAWSRISSDTASLRLARRLLHTYSIMRRAAEAELRDIVQSIQNKDAWRLLTLLAAATLSGINMGESERLATELRSRFKGRWPIEVETYLGLFRGLVDMRVKLEESYPKWLLRYLTRLMGRHEAMNLLRFQNEENPPIYITLNTLLLPEEKILQYIDRLGINAVIDGRLPSIYVIEELKDSSSLRRVMDEGIISMHDFSSYYAVQALKPSPGDKVLDVCAAPGTKTWLMAKIMENEGKIISVDSSWNRIISHLRRMRKMGVKNAEDLVADATKPLPLTIKADKVLLDPPCSSTGLFWREPGYRWTVKPRHIRMFRRLQSFMLESVSRNVTKKGEILYSTCSITLEENELVVEDFLKNHPEFELAEVEPKIGSSGMRNMVECRRLYPHRDRCNGFFLAKLVKRW